MNYFFHSATLFALSFVIYQLTQTGKAIMSTQDQVDALTAQVNKVHLEVASVRDDLVGQIDSLKEQLDKVGVTEHVDLSGLQGAIQSLDDINPDVPAEVPDEVPADVPSDPVEDVPAQDAPPF